MDNPFAPRPAPGYIYQVEGYSPQPTTSMNIAYIILLAVAALLGEMQNSPNITPELKEQILQTSSIATALAIQLAADPATNSTITATSTPMTITVTPPVVTPQIVAPSAPSVTEPVAQAAAPELPAPTFTINPTRTLVRYDSMDEMTTRFEFKSSIPAEASIYQCWKNGTEIECRDTPAVVLPIVAGMQNEPTFYSTDLKTSITGVDYWRVTLKANGKTAEFKGNLPRQNPLDIPLPKAGDF